jgi:phosphoesterase RecJ-like protein
VLQFVRDHEHFFVVGHMEPDADCIGSELALGSALERLGKSVQLLNPGPFDRPEIQPFESRFASDATRGARNRREAAIIVDCSSPDRIEPLGDQLDDLPAAVIDHHRTSSPFGTVAFIRSDIPANTILVAALIEAVGLQPTADEAEHLFLGLVTDTGFFRFLEADQAVAFETAARLTAAGASPRLADQHLSSGRSWGSRILIGRMLLRTEQLAGGQTLLTHMTRRDELDTGPRRDSDALYRLMLAVEGVRVIAVVKEKDNGCTISFRANDDTDVSVVAAEFGGGGHQKASGAFFRGPLSDLLPQLRSRLESL